MRYAALMRLGIDASNLRAGGGVTHLVELLRAADPFAHGFSQVIIWGGQATLRQIEDRPWLLKRHQSLLEKGLIYRVFWQRFNLSKIARAAGCDVLFVPGGAYAGDFQPVVTMSRNLLPFEWRELHRYGLSLMMLKLLLLRWIQARSFRKADGLIFLTRYAQNTVMRVVKHIHGETTVIPHGINDRFVCLPGGQHDISQYSFDRPFRILYVSIVDMYKHQWHAAAAVAQLRESGLPVVLELAGPSYSPALKRLRQTLRDIDPAGEFVWYSGPVPHADLHAHYEKADLCLFASSCENMPNILLEGMASGLPIACSRRGPMPEVLGDAGVYFDPETPDDIARALRTLIESPELRERLAEKSSERIRIYSWTRCADETLEFLAHMTVKNSK